MWRARGEEGRLLKSFGGQDSGLASVKSGSGGVGRAPVASTRAGDGAAREPHGAP